MLEDLKQDSKIGMNCRHLACRSKFGFTLAEVLIVIGIIGVVAALTLPNLNHATGDKEKVTRVKKIYSALTEALDRAQAIYGPASEWVPTDVNSPNVWGELAARRITEFMKVSKVCAYEPGCWSNGTFYWQDGNEMESLASHGGYGVLLADGTSLAFLDNGIQRIRVDIDGPNKGKNQWGNDIFEFNFCYDKEDSPSCEVVNEIFYGRRNIGSDKANFDTYATTWVIENGNLDYLKASRNDDYDFECSNGKILNWTTNTSCH